MKKLLSTLLTVWLALGLWAGTALADEAEQAKSLELTLNEAVARALAHSEAVKKAAKEIDRTKAWRDYRADQLDYTPVGPPGNPAIEIAWSNLLAADLTWRMSKKSLTAEQDAVALDTCKKYWDVQQAQVAVTAAERALRQAELDFRKAQVSYRVDLISGEALQGAEVRLAGAKAALAKARGDLDKAYTAFNQLVGLGLEERPALVDELTFTSLEVTDLDYAVTKVLEASPSVWLAQEKVTLQQYLEDLMFYTGEYRPYQARKIEVEQAELDAVSVKEAMELVTRSLYHSVKSLEESIPAAEQAVKTAGESLRVAKLKYEVGMATKADVAAAEAKLAEAEKSLHDLLAKHAYLKLAFEKPWAYLGASTAGDSSSTGSEGSM